MNWKRGFLLVFVFALAVAIIELCGYAYLQHFTIEGSFERNVGVGNKIRRYLLNPNDTTAQPRYLPQETVGFIHNPKFYQDGIKQNNRYGWRGKDFSVIKPDSVYRIVCMGGSTTYGFGVTSPDSSYPSLLQKVLERKYPDKKIEVINAGVAAISSF
jgi:hypothetical protein